MGRDTYKQPEADLSVEERIAINNARTDIRSAKALLAKYGVHDDPEPLTELGYEQRMARARALELAVQYAATCSNATDEKVVAAADKFYGFIWIGETGA